MVAVEGPELPDPGAALAGSACDAEGEGDGECLCPNFSTDGEARKNTKNVRFSVK